MKCPNCGAEMKASKRNYRYEESGLKNVMLMGVNFWDCPECKEAMPELFNIDALNEGIANILIKKESLLMGEEIRFLRKKMGLSGTDFASRVGVHPVTVSRWESNREPIGPQSDRLIRAIYLFYKEQSCNTGLITFRSESFDVFSKIAKKIADEPKSEPISIPQECLVSA